ncbi:MAG TPA: desulfoferrodoxin [Firmicutes bacterium]|nr:desulfoferrodoxin [Candidatus Fermentithermobacillaceae bacterium]
MTVLNQVYRCSVCGNIVEIVHAGKGTLACCGKSMELLLEKSQQDDYSQKHVPVVAQAGDGVKVTVGSVPHPMEENHYIEWVEVLAGERVCRKALRPGDAPEVVFEGHGTGGTVRAYCNLHGLWKASYWG